MRTGGVEIIPGTIEVDGDQVDRVEIVLLTIRLALHEKHLLGEPVRRVRFLGVTVPKILLAEWYWREFRIGAHRTDRHKLRDTCESGLFHQLEAHNRVLVEETTGVLTIRTDPADYRRQVNHKVRPPICDRTSNGISVSQVVVPLSWNEDIGRSCARQPLDNPATQETVTARHHHSSICPKTIHALPP